MMDEAYPHPLDSFEHLHDLSGLGPEEAAYAIPVAHGYLITRPALRRRAQAITTLYCLGAVRHCVTTHAHNGRDLAARGFPAGWGASLTYWGERLQAAEDARDDLALALRITTWQRHGLLECARLKWQSLSVAAQQARLPALLPRRVPRSDQALMASLREGARLAAHPAEAAALSRYGFAAAEQEALSQVLGALCGLEAAQADQQRARRAAGCAVITIRGALLGELARFSRVGQQLLPEREAEGLQMERLLRT